MYGEETADENQSTMKTQTDIFGENLPKSNGADVMQDVSRTRGWDIPRTGTRRPALFTSDGTYSGSSESDTSEGHVDRPPEGQNGTDRRTNEIRTADDGISLNAIQPDV